MGALDTLNLCILFTGTSISVLSNVLVIIVMIREPKLRLKPGNFYIIPLAVFDLLAAIMCPVSVVKQINFTSCVWIVSITLVVFDVTINLLLFVSLDRYLAICHPKLYGEFILSGFRKCILPISVAIPSLIAIGLGLEVLPVLDWDEPNYTGTCNMLSLLRGGLVYVACFLMFGSTLAIVILYGLIFKELATFKNQPSLTTNESENQLEEIKIVKTMGLIIGSFIICWLPVMITFVALAFTNDANYFQHLFGTYFGNFLSEFMTYHGLFNTVIDPVIYALRMKEFRKSVMKLIQFQSQ